MKKAYWIVQVDMTQPEAFAAYVAANGEALARYGTRFLARAGEHCVVEGHNRAAGDAKHHLNAFADQGFAHDLCAGSLFRHSFAPT